MLYYGDVTYLVILPALLLALLAQANVTRTYNKYSKVLTHRHMTGRDAARRILDAHGLQNVPIEHISGSLTDHYDPKANVIRLSEGVYGSDSVAAVGVAAHEAGHAVQYAEKYAPIRLRNAVIPATQIGSRLAIPIFLIGLIFSYYELTMVGVLLFSLTALFQLITLPVEFNASHRALRILEDNGILDSEELVGSRKVLRAAALTYVAALASSVSQILRLLLLAGGTRRRR